MAVVVGQHRVAVGGHRWDGPREADVKNLTVLHEEPCKWAEVNVHELTAPLVTDPDNHTSEQAAMVRLLDGLTEDSVLVHLFYGGMHWPDGESMHYIMTADSAEHAAWYIGEKIKEEWVYGIFVQALVW
jgi:hypothetical protein